MGCRVPSLGLIMKTLRILFAPLVFFACMVAHGATTAFTDFNPNQFGTNNFKIVVKTNAPLTNIVYKVIDTSTGRGVLVERNVESFL